MITVLGASGFIGSQLVNKLEADGWEYRAIGRNDELPKTNLGNVIYCIGVTADFRWRLLDTVEAHVCYLLRLVRNCEFDSLLYLSSARVYIGEDFSNEDQSLRIAPRNADDLYNISKAMGESIVLNCGRQTRVARVSNVYGPDFNSENFLSSILKDAMTGEKVIVRTAPDSAKDYINVADVVQGLIQIATSGRERIYNLAGGVNVSHRELMEKLRILSGCQIEFATDAPVVNFPPIDIERMRREFNFTPSSVLDDLPELVRVYQANKPRRLK